MTDYFHLNAAPDTVRAISSLGLAHLGHAVGAGIAAPTACPRTPAGRITRPPPGWRPCSAGCGFRAAQSGSTNCLL